MNELSVCSIFFNNNLKIQKMDRKKEIDEMARTTASHITSDKDMQVAFADALRRGAEWADEHPHWISVDDELPPNKELVFITDGEFTDMGFYDYTDDAWQPCEKWLDDITHWMPLPEAPTCSEKPNNCEKGE